MRRVQIVAAAHRMQRRQRDAASVAADAQSEDPLLPEVEPSNDDPDEVLRAVDSILKGD
jgi:hypothetical protein